MEEISQKVEKVAKSCKIGKIKTLTLGKTE